MNVPNILITNYCNQSCSYCFAKELMKDKKIDQEMSIENFKKVVRKIKKIKDINVIKLLGGEPTLHSKFEEIINISLANFEYIQIFTNGLFSEDKALFMKKHLPKIHFTININTPNFQQNPQSRKLIIKRIQEFAKSTEIALSITINPNSNINQIIHSLGNKVLKNVTNIRIGISNITFGEKPDYSFKELQYAGKKLMLIIKKIKAHNTNIGFNLNCGIIKCMFDDKDLFFLRKNNVNSTGWGCYGKNTKIDIKTNLTANYCYSVSQIKNMSIKKYKMNKSEEILFAKQCIYLSNYELTECKKCRHYGLEQDKCPGPCVGFRYYDSKAFFIN